MYTTFTIEEKGRAWEELRRAEKLYTKNHKYCILLEIAGHKKVLVLLCNYPFSKIEGRFLRSVFAWRHLFYKESTFSRVSGSYPNMQEVLNIFFDIWIISQYSRGLIPSLS